MPPRTSEPHSHDDDPFEAPQAVDGVLSVSELTGRIKDLLGGLGRVCVEGEVASLRQPSSGHLYFNLKDRLRGVESVLNCAIWRSQVARACRTPLEEGAKIVAHGRLDVYAPRGNYSLIVDRIEARGMGAMLERLERLKAELKQRGWFERSRSLPRLPRRIGVVTSRDGAAFQDFLRTRSLRWPQFPVRLAHSAVQGAGAAQEIAAAIRALDASGVELIVITRGGGSLEDLWAFNELPVAEAIWQSSVPVVSGVGHETDSTLADFVADHRAHTPTDAATRVIPDRRALDEELERLLAHLLGAVDAQLAQREEELERLARSRHLRDPRLLLSDRVKELDSLGRHLGLALRNRLEHSGGRIEHLGLGLERHSPRRALDLREERLAGLVRRLREAGLGQAEQRAHHLELLQRSLGAISPLAVLQRGYSITRPVAGGAPLRSVAGLELGAELETLLADGRLRTTVDAVQPAEGSEPG